MDFKYIVLGLGITLAMPNVRKLNAQYNIRVTQWTG